MSNTNRDGWLNLANAIVIQACADYQSGQYSKKALRDFFNSSYFNMLVRESLDPDLLIRHLEEVCQSEKKSRIHKKHAQLHTGMR